MAPLSDTTNATWQVGYTLIGTPHIPTANRIAVGIPQFRESSITISIYA